MRFAASAPPSSIGLMADVIEGEGLDEQHGLDLEFSEFTPDAAEQALLTGQVDTGFFALISWAKVTSEGRDVVLLGPIQQNHGAVIVAADSPYQSLEDLQGQRIATLNPVSGLYTSMQVLAAELGLDWTEDFEVISGPPPGLVSFLETGEVEAIVHFEPTVSTLLAGDRYRAVMTPSEAWREATGSPLFMLGLATSGSYAQDNPCATQRLTEMMAATMDLMSADPELLAQYLGDFDLSPEVVEIAKGAHGRDLHRRGRRGGRGHRAPDPRPLGGAGDHRRLPRPDLRLADHPLAPLAGRSATRGREHASHRARPGGRGRRDGRHEAGATHRRGGRHSRDGDRGDHRRGHLRRSGSRGRRAGAT